MMRDDEGTCLAMKSRSIMVMGIVDAFWPFLLQKNKVNKSLYRQIHVDCDEQKETLIF